MSLLTELSEKVQQGCTSEVVSLIEQALDEGMPAQQILDEGMLDGLGKLSVRFRNSEVFIGELLQASKALNVGMGLLKSLLFEDSIALRGKVVIATVEGDLHDIGKNLIRYMLEGIGVEVIDLGADIPAVRIVEAVRKHKPDILALSALLTTTMERQRDVIKALRIAGLRRQVKVIVGGAPITEEFSESIGADGYAADAATVVDLIKRLLKDKA
ncbi:MAG: cobalamin-dependent protein [Coriobacteriales bacterium]|nr:cobalamin-dependent protein [Coriobacteriales bacterium]